MDSNEAFSSTIERKEDKHVFWEPKYELSNQLWILQRNTKCNELNSFYYVQRLIWSEQLHSLYVLINYEKWGRVLTQKQ